MTAHATPPGCMTDREFLEGHCNGNQFEGQEWRDDRYRREAARAGVDVKGKIYVSGLAGLLGIPRRGAASVRRAGVINQYTNSCPAGPAILKAVEVAGT